MSAADVPRYVLYGDAGILSDWFLNVESLDRRCRERGWVIAPHVHPRFAQIILCEGGGGEMSVDGDRRAFGAGSVLVVPPHRIHGFRYRRSTHGRVVTIEQAYLARLLERAPPLAAIVAAAGVFDLDPQILPSIATVVSALEDEATGAGPGSAIGAEIQLLSLLLLLLRHWPQVERPRQPAPDARSDLVARYRCLVEERYREQPSLGEVASELKVSVSQLRLACRTVIGVSPLSVMHDRVLTEAKRCLSYTTMSVAEIADWLAFSDAGYFSRFFSRVAGRSPTVYRREQNAGGHAATSWHPSRRSR